MGKFYNRAAICRHSEGNNNFIPKNLLLNNQEIDNSRNSRHSERQRKNPADYNKNKSNGEIYMNNSTETDQASMPLYIFASKSVSLLGWKAQPTSNVGGVGTPPYVANSTQLQGKKNSLTETNLFTHSPIHLFTLKRAAFTLAEVLITLGIIGIVAALTLPTVISNYKKQVTVSKLQKAYSTINNAFKQSEAANESSEFWDDPFVTGSQPYFEKYFKPYLNGAKQCFSYQECGYKERCPYKFLNNDEAPFVTSMDAHSLKNDRFAFYLPDGTFYWIITGAGGSNYVPASILYIDINGGDGPNIISKDVFQFTRKTGKGIFPSCYQYSQASINSDCSTRGSCCATKIMQDGWKITYPF